MIACDKKTCSKRAFIAAVAGLRRVWAGTARALLLGLAAAVGSGEAAAQEIVLASTTSTEQSGLFSVLLPRFTQVTGIRVKVVALGTGQAIDMARRGDADVLLVHDRVAEDRLVADGFAVQRKDVMYNDFVLIGPQDDPAQVRGKDIVAALKRLAAGKANFISRGDKSGTHAAELRFWSLAGQAGVRGVGYRACGCGMGSALNIAASSGAYVLSDRGTWLNFKNRVGLALLVQGDRRLLNQYGVLLVSTERHPHVKAAEGKRFVDWLLGQDGQAAIAAYKIGGEPLFFPNAAR